MERLTRISWTKCEELGINQPRIQLRGLSLSSLLSSFRHANILPQLLPPKSLRSQLPQSRNRPSIPQICQEYETTRRKSSLQNTLFHQLTFPSQEIIPATTEFNRRFLDLLYRIFVYDPRKRITAKQALAHPWFSETLLDDGTEALKIRLEKERAGFR